MITRDIFFWLDIQFSSKLSQWVYDDGLPVTWSKWDLLHNTSSDVYALQTTSSALGYLWYAERPTNIGLAAQLCQCEQVFLSLCTK